ncbi:MFS transporter [Neokomagataea thailandica]|uniref:Major facilitator superfamily transporter n=1 Tax=Neokomagataea tanensis NBRC 106556 TaxID=1223519 RepID=A0ABQ0QHJ2_9PROT|nr:MULTISPECIES: MFS transporter [Neokomagataea]GBR45002.1 major facilitator superfamily transporter [Neokomagataea tanensis NBRC 106556]
MSLSLFKTIPGFRSLAFSRLCSQLASSTLAVAIGWHLYDMTHSVAALGYIGLAQFLPMVPLTFISGHVADRFNRQRVVQICQALEALTLLAMTIATLCHALHPAGIYALGVMLGTLRSFEMPCQQAFLPSLTPAALLPQAQSLVTSLFMVASIAGPSLGGLLYGLGPAVSYGITSALFLAAFISTSNIRLMTRAASKDPVTLSSVFAGLAFLSTRRDLLGAISMDLFAVLLGGATAMLPVYAESILHAGPMGLGLLRAAPAIGALGMSLWLARYPLGRRSGMSMYLSVFVFGVATIIFGGSHTIWVSILALITLGAADVISMVVRSSLVQLATPDAMRGRVSAVNTLFIGSSNQLGEFESGMIGAAIGPEAAVITGGIGTILVAAAWIPLFPRLWSLDRLEEIKPE